MRARLRRTFRLWLAVVTVAAFVLRMWGLGGLGDLDFDEQASFFIGSMPPQEMLAYLVRAPFEHPPGFYLLFHVWLLVAGPTESAMRLFSVLLGTMAVPVVGLAAGRAAGPRAGIVAAACLAIMPLHVFYGRDARMYPLLALLVAVALAAVGSAPTGVGEAPAHRRATGLAQWVAWGALAAALATHYYAVLAVVGMGAGAAVARWWDGASGTSPGPRPHPAAPARGLAGLSQRERHESDSLPLWERVGVRAWLQRAGEHVSPGGAFWRRSALQIAALSIATIGVGAWLSAASGLQTSLTAVYPRFVDPTRIAAALVESVGAALAGPLASPLHQSVGAVLAVALLALAALGWRRAKPDASGARLGLMAFGGLVAVVVGVPLLLFLGREFAPRFVVLATPFLATLIGLGSVGWSGRATAGVSMVLGGAALLGVAPYYGYERSDYGRAMEHLRGLVVAGDAVVLNGPWQNILYQRYGQGLPPGQIIASTVPLQEDEAVGRLERLTRQHSRVWVVDSATDAADPTGVVARWLDAHAYPRPVIEYRKALLRPYLTETGAAGSLEPRETGAELLGMAVESVALERWALSPGEETRVRVSGKELCTAAAQPCRSPGERRLALQLVGPSGPSVWHWDGALTPIADGFEYRAALVVPRDAAGGAYELRATAYERGFDAAGAAQVQRVSEETVVGVVRVTALR